jgi:hypothetical protein
MKNKAFTSSTCREAARRPHSPHKQAQNNVEEVALRGTASKFVSHTSSNPLILSHQKFLRLKLTLATPYSESRSAPQSKKNPATIMSQMPIFNMQRRNRGNDTMGKVTKTGPINLTHKNPLKLQTHNNNKLQRNVPTQNLMQLTHP